MQESERFLKYILDNINIGDMTVHHDGVEYEYTGKEWVKVSTQNTPLGFMSLLKKPYKYKTNKSINKRKKNSLYKNKGSYYGR